MQLGDCETQKFVEYCDNISAISCFAIAYLNTQLTKGEDSGKIEKVLLAGTMSVNAKTPGEETEKNDRTSTEAGRILSAF